MDNEKTKREAYRPLIAYIVMCALLVYCGVVIYYDWMTNSFADNFIMLVTIVMVFVAPIYTVIVTIRYILIISKKDVPTWKKVLWGIVLFEFNVWAFPIFWRLHIRIESSESEERYKVSGTTVYETAEYTPSRLEYDKEYRKEVAARNREFDKKRRAEIRENKAREKQNQRLERRKEAAERKQKAVSFLSRRTSVLFAVVPALLLILFLVLNEFQLAYMLDIPYSVYDFLEVVLKGLPIVIILAVIICLVHFVFRVVCNEEFGTGKKIGWIVVLIVFNLLAFPCYWNMYLRGDSEDADAKKAKDAFVWALVPGISLILLVLAMILLLGVALDANLTWMVIELILVIVPIAYIFVALKYILLVCENELLTRGKKVLWSIGFILLGVVICPVYWFKNIKVRS